jgi:hypothetical protein
MVPLLNTFNIDCSVTGNHDFGAIENETRGRKRELTAGRSRLTDHSFAHLTTLIKDCTFPCE